MTDEPRLYVCRRAGCGETFPSRESLWGHIGGAHGNPHTRGPVEHGTVKGYKQELLRYGKGKTCQRCRGAWRRYVQDRRAVGRARKATEGE